MRGRLGGAILLLACNSKVITVARPDAAAPPDDGFSITFPDGSPPVPAAREDATCAAETIKADRLPLDVFLLMDASSSMNALAGPAGQTRWQLVRDAVAAFVSDARSVGLQVGLGFLPAPLVPCQVDADCAPAFAGMAVPPGACAPDLGSGVCVDARGKVIPDIPCTPWIANDPPVRGEPALHPRRLLRRQRRRLHRHREPLPGWGRDQHLRPPGHLLHRPRGGGRLDAPLPAPGDGVRRAPRGGGRADRAARPPPPQGG
jgi:hypothetical protein